MTQCEVIGSRIAAEALALVGAPFRLHGRDARTGLDCVGLCLAALRGAGWPVAEPGHYTLRGSDAGRVTRMIGQSGLVAGSQARAGDILLVRTGPMQLHLMIASEAGHVHAHAGLGRVVHMPGPSLWPVLGRWRVPDQPEPMEG